MIKQVFKLLPDQYENFYLGNEVQSTSGVVLQLNLNNFTVTVTTTSGSIELEKDKYIVEISNKYVVVKDIEDMFDDDQIDSVATNEEIIDLVDSLFE